MFSILVLLPAVAPLSQQYIAEVGKSGGAGNFADFTGQEIEQCQEICGMNHSFLWFSHDLH